MRYPVLFMVSLASCSLLIGCNKSDTAAQQQSGGGAAGAQAQMPPTIVNVQPNIPDDSTYQRVIR